MSDSTNPSPPPNERDSITARWLRILGSAVLLLILFVSALEIYGRTGKSESITVFPLLELTRFARDLATGLAFGGLLVGLAALLVVLRDLHRSFTRMERFQYEQKEPPVTPPDAERSARSVAGKSDGEPDGMPPAPWREVVGLLADLRDNSLLTESERRDKRVRVAEEEFQDASTRIHAMMKEGDFVHARELADYLARRHPADKRSSQLMDEVEHARERHESEDVRACTRQVEDLISISAWGRARDLAQQLQQRHPDSPDARKLLLKIETEHRVFEEEQMRRMNAEVQRFVTRRRWEEALAVARAFIERFPGCEESESLRMQLPTLEANAEIEVRQQFEARIMEFVRHGRYLEAVELSRKVIDQYPDSPQAEVLRSQLERLEELAENPSATPARVRID